MRAVLQTLRRHAEVGCAYYQIGDGVGGRTEPAVRNAAKTRCGVLVDRKILF